MSVTLEKMLQSQGFGSRKLCRQLVLDGRIGIGGIICTDPGISLETDSLVFQVDDEIWTYHDHLYLMRHKPAGYECSHRPQHHPSGFSLFPSPFIRRGLQCVGRLDQDTTGLLLFSDDGCFIHRYTSPRKKIPKHYVVTTSGPVENGQLEQLVNGVSLKDESMPTSALTSRRLGEYRLGLVIAEGKYHQVKRMIAAAGNHVEKLHRVAIGGLTLADDLAPGQWRHLDGKDLKQLDILPEG